MKPSTHVSDGDGCRRCAVWCSELFIVFHGSWQGFESQKLLDEQLLDKSNVLSFVTEDAGLRSGQRRPRPDDT